MSKTPRQRKAAVVALSSPRPAKPAVAAAKIAELPELAAASALLSGLADQSPFLWGLARRDPERFLRLFACPPQTALDQALAAVRAQCDAAVGDEAVVSRALRRAKQEVALLVAIADLDGTWDVVAVTRALARAADVFVGSALRFLLCEASARGEFLHADPQNIESQCGFVVLALGKHGAMELNYSSDVDLVVFFDPETQRLSEGVEPGRFFVRLAQRLARLLQERTADGYVLRVDLRLRPDPGSTSVAISLPAARNYYETLGQNWERAALIKARAIAGDIALGNGFLEELAPFIWRKYFDYAAIADIHAMKRQIHAVRGHAEIKVGGHDVKLGRGGIREIEFFVQTQQLIFGGRRMQLRGARTLDMLSQLAADGWITSEAALDLSQAYRFLRGVEHRLQMLNDQQTQRLPSDKAALRAFARFCGFDGTTGFSAALLRHLRAVEKHYARLFEHAPALDVKTGPLVFTGVADDPETIETLRNMGFKAPSRAAETVRGWHFGRRPAVQSARAREVLTELAPALLQAFSGSGDPDAALAAFDEALARMPGAVELFSILKSHRKVRELFADILGGAPCLARVIAQRPHVLDGAIDHGLLNETLDDPAYDARIGAYVEHARHAEEFLDAIRDYAAEEKFLIGVRLFASSIEPQAAAYAYSALAGAVARACFATARELFALEHGVIKGGRCVVLAMGKLGSREMTAASDLDLILLYDFDADAAESDGRRPLHATSYFTRLTQRLIASLTASTRRGGLYQVDMRLRPSGRQGPLATQIVSFADYQDKEAEGWEHMALTRARVIAGDESLAREVGATIEAILRRPRDVRRLAREVRDMRALIAREKGENDRWDLKLAAGGVMDIEFIAQYLALAHACTHKGLLKQETRAILRAAVDAKLLDQEDGESLLDAAGLYANVTQILKLALDEGANPEKSAEGVKRRLAGAADLPDFAQLSGELDRQRRRTRAIFETTLATPKNVSR